MHSIRNLKAVEYKGCNIYVRNFNNTFEYLAVVQGKLYTMHMTITKGWKELLLGRDYTEKQLTDITKYLMVAAETTVDIILGEQSVKKTSK
jgi:hypothetical protein